MEAWIRKPMKVVSNVDDSSKAKNILDRAWNESLFFFFVILTASPARTIWPKQTTYIDMSPISQSLYRYNILPSTVTFLIYLGGFYPLLPFSWLLAWFTNPFYYPVSKKSFEGRILMMPNKNPIKARPELFLSPNAYSCELSAPCPVGIPRFLKINPIYFGFKKTLLNLNFPNFPGVKIRFVGVTHPQNEFKYKCSLHLNEKNRIGMK